MIEIIEEILASLGITLLDILVIIAIFFFAKLIVNTTNNLTRRTVEKSRKLMGKKENEDVNEVRTSMSVYHSANRYFVYAIAVILSLNVLGLGKEVSSALVAAGIGGLIISLGAQSIVKDVLAGVFLQFEKQYLIGDRVKIGEHEGYIDSVSIRVTYIDCDGKKVSIPNGEIKHVVNYSASNGVAIVKIPLPYNVDTRKAMSIINKTTKKYYNEHSDILTENSPSECSINKYETYFIDTSVRLETKPLKQWDVERVLRLLIKEDLEKNGIELAHNASFDMKRKV